MAFKGTVTFFFLMITFATFSTISAKEDLKEDFKSKAIKSEGDPRLFFLPLTGTATNPATTSITIGQDTIALLGLLFLLLLLALIVPAIIGGSLFGGLLGKDEPTGYAPTSYAAPPVYGHHEESSYAVHRLLEDAADKFN